MKNLKIKKSDEKLYSKKDMENAFNSAREFNSLDGIVDINIILPMGGNTSDLQPLHLTFNDWLNSLKIN